MTQSHSKSPKRFRREIGSWLFLLPHLFFFALFVVVPLVFGLVISFFNWSLLKDNVFVGFNNYIRTWNDSRFWPTVQHTVLFAIISVPLTIIVAIIFAHILKKKRFGQLWLLIAFVSPAFFGSVGILSSWKWIFASFPSGLANYYLNKVGAINNAVSWFGSTSVAWGVIILVTVWWIVGFSILLYLGALQRIPPEQYESAKLDGAGPWKRFLYITLPWIKSVLFFDVVRQAILAFGLFDQAYILSGGGPAGTTRTLVYYLYLVGFERQDFGRAAAISWYIFAIVLIFAVIQLVLVTKSIRSTEG